MLELTVYGVARPKGSTRAFRPKGSDRIIVTNDNPRTKPWQTLIADTAQEAIRKQLDGRMFDGAVGLEVTFWLPRPKSLPRRVVAHTRKPDLDKLVRAVKDALTGAGVWRDDAQVVSVRAAKGYAVGNECARAVIRVEDAGGA
jgi:crossover junction endodeoxyribonuclease RusA